MTFYGSFDNIKGKNFNIEIKTPKGNDEINLTMGENSCTLATSSENLFAPIKSRSLTIEIFSTQYYMDLYDPSARSTSVKLYDEDNKVWFRGYLTPCVYDQDFTYADTIQLEAVDGISTGKDFKWVPDGNYHTLLDILLTIIRDCGYRDYLYVPKVYTHINGKKITSDGLDKMSVSSMNFVDDDDEHTPWTQYEVVKEIMKFLGWSFIPDGDNVWLIDYKAEYNAPVTYNVYNIETGSLIDDTYTSSNAAIPVNLDILAPGTSEISIDDIYNKISISDNLYEIEEVAPNIFDTENTEDIKIKVNDNVTTLTLGNTQWIKTTVKKHWLRDDEVNTDVIGYEYQTFSLLKPETGFTHHFYEKDLFQEIYNEGFSNCQDTGSKSVYTGTQVNKYINTIGCVLQRYAYRPNDGASNLPTSLDWTDYLTFFITDDSLNNNSGKILLSRLKQLELPVLNYDIKEDIVYKPKSGTSWITIKGDIFYQYNNAKYGEKNKTTLNIINVDKHLYTTAPVDKCSDIGGQQYCGIFRGYDQYKDTAYGKGFSCWKMKLQIGDKYWNGTSWTSQESTFYLKYNNNPSNRDDEYLPAFSWASIVPNTDYTDKVGENAYCIPIDAKDDNAPNHGQLHLTIYTPSLIPTELVSIFSEVFHTDVELNWMNLPPVIYVKDFELDYVYTDTSKWWAASKDDNKDDKLYVGYINDTYKQEFNNLELKINTATEDKPISRSYVITDFGLLDTLKHKNQEQAKIQEYNLVDMYLDHYSDKKIIYKANVHGTYTPETKFSKTSLPGTFFIDSSSYDLRKDINKVNLIAF